jgi:predicted transglutaminase-like cysteine proteinase
MHPPHGAGRSGRARVGIINRAVDLAIRPVSNETQWGVRDHWSDPLEMLHSGDCEDYALVKYVTLLAAGLSKDAVKIVVLKNRLPNEDRAVLAVRTDSQWLILDNRILTLVRDTDVTRRSRSSPSTIRVSGDLFGVVGVEKRPVDPSL